MEPIIQHPMVPLLCTTYNTRFEDVHTAPAIVSKRGRQVSLHIVVSCIFPIFAATPSLWYKTSTHTALWLATVPVVFSIFAF